MLKGEAQVDVGGGAGAEDVAPEPGARGVGSTTSSSSKSADEPKTPSDGGGETDLSDVPPEWLSSSETPEGARMPDGPIGAIFEPGAAPRPSALAPAPLPPGGTAAPRDDMDDGPPMPGGGAPIGDMTPFVRGGCMC